jgi:hypothetical protein
MKSFRQSLLGSFHTVRVKRLQVEEQDEPGRMFADYLRALYLRSGRWEPRGLRLDLRNGMRQSQGILVRNPGFVPLALEPARKAGRCPLPDIGLVTLGRASLKRHRGAPNAGAILLDRRRR